MWASACGTMGVSLSTSTTRCGPTGARAAMARSTARRTCAAISTRCPKASSGAAAAAEAMQVAAAEGPIKRARYPSRECAFDRPCTRTLWGPHRRPPKPRHAALSCPSSKGPINGLLPRNPRIALLPPPYASTIAYQEARVYRTHPLTSSRIQDLLRYWIFAPCTSTSVQCPKHVCSTIVFVYCCYTKRRNSLSRYLKLSGSWDRGRKAFFLLLRARKACGISHVVWCSGVLHLGADFP